MIQLIRLRAVIATLILSVVCSLGALAQMGQVKSCSQNKGKVTVNSANGKTIIEFYSDDMVKITPIYKGCRLLPKASASVQLTPLKTKAVVKMAYEKRQPTEKLLFHSDQGSNYTSNEFRKYLRSIHVTQSFSNPEMPYDNSVMESLFGGFKREALYRYRFKTEKDFSKVLKHTLTSIITSVRILFS